MTALSTSVTTTISPNSALFVRSTVPFSTNRIDLPISDVDLARSFAFLAGNEHGGTTRFVGAEPNDRAGVTWFTAELPDPTTLRLTRGADDEDAAVSWFVIELP